MSLSLVQYTGDGSNKTFTIHFSYISQSHVKVYVDGVLTSAYTFPSVGSILMTTAPAAGAVVLIKRVTPIDTRMVDFQDGSTNTEELLDLSATQTFYAVQESSDAAAATIGLALDGTMDATNKRIKNVADPVNAQDAVTKAYVDSTIPASVAAASASASAAAASASSATSQASSAASSASSAASSLAALSQFSGAALGGNLSFTSTGQRITGDFSNATVANRVMFQTSTANGSTVIGAIPNGTATDSNLQLYSSVDPANSSFVNISCGLAASEVRLNSNKTGTGTYLPMTFYTGGSERMRIDTSGNVGIGTSSTANSRFNYSGSFNAGTIGSFTSAQGFGSYGGGLSFYDATAASGFYAQDSGATLNVFTGQTGSDSASSKIRFKFTATDSVHVHANGGLGYGTGSGGTVTQATSKSTAVTLNKPTGQITMNAASLAANTNVRFTVNNSICGGADVPVVTLAAGVSPSSYQVTVDGVGVGGFSVNVRNITAGALAEAIVLNFAIIKGATA